MARFSPIAIAIALVTGSSICRGDTICESKNLEFEQSSETATSLENGIQIRVIGWDQARIGEGAPQRDGQLMYGMVNFTSNVKQFSGGAVVHDGRILLTDSVSCPKRLLYLSCREINAAGKKGITMTCRTGSIEVAPLYEP